MVGGFLRKKAEEIVSEEGLTLYDNTSRRKYFRKRLLGKGGFAKCYEVMGEDRKNYACKIVPKSLLVKPHHKEKMASEIAIHRSLKHPNVVQFVSYFEDKENVYVLLELCDNRSMMELHKRRRCLTDQEVRYYFKQIVEGCAYLHELKVIHRDLKLGNLFLDNDMRVKIGDFGLAAKLENDFERKKTLCGTPNYIAPEVLEKVGHSYEVDIWSAGCILYTLYVGIPPFETKTLSSTYDRIKNNDYTIPSKVPKAAQNLIIKMLQRNPKDRPTMKEILKSKFFEGYPIPASLPRSALSVAPRLNDQVKNYIRGSAGIPSITPILKSSDGSNRYVIAGNQNVLHVVNGFESKRLVPLKYYPIIPFTFKQNQAVEQKMDANAVHVKDGNMISFVEDPVAVDDEPDDCYLNDLLSKLVKFLELKPENYETIQLEDAEDPKSTPLYWIGKWVDYSEKYGLGYELCDNTIGVLFNDVTQLLCFHGNNNVGTYIDYEGNESCIDFNDSPQEMLKKTQIFRNFYHYMDSNLVSTGSDVKIDRTLDMARSPFVRLWIRNDDVIIFQLTCGILQANFFGDHTKLIMCPKMGAISFIDEQRQFKTYTIAGLEKYGCPKHIVDRVQYVVYVAQKVLSFSAAHLQK